jgi:hypothetical protein
MNKEALDIIWSFNEQAPNAKIIYTKLKEAGFNNIYIIDAEQAYNSLQYAVNLSKFKIKDYNYHLNEYNRWKIAHTNLLKYYGWTPLKIKY